MTDKLRAAVQLVLALHERQGALGKLTAEMDPQYREHGWMVNLDPMAEAQLRAALAEPWLSDEDTHNIVEDWLALIDGADTYEGHASRALIRRARAYFHPPTADCEVSECVICAERDCPHGEPLHYHHDGCPACDVPSPKTSVDIESLRALQYAANGLSFSEFCDAVGWERNSYSQHKWKEFQGLGRLGVFDGDVLKRTIQYHQALEERRERAMKENA